MTTLTIPTVETARLRLRAPAPSDFEAYAAFRTASPRTAGIGGLASRSDAFDIFCALTGHWAARGYGRWIVADKDTDAPLGVVGLYFPEGWPEPEIGWQVFDVAEGKGVAYEAAAASRRYAYEDLGWTTVISLIRSDNTRSQALARRMGATLDAPYQHPTYGQMDVWRHLPPGQPLPGEAA